MPKKPAFHPIVRLPSPTVLPAAMDPNMRGFLFSEVDRILRALLGAQCLSQSGFDNIQSTLAKERDLPQGGHWPAAAPPAGL
jgi:hypothetical protein